MSQSNVEKVRKAYSDFEKGDVPAVLEMLSPDVEWVVPEGAYLVGGLHKGHNALVQEVFMPLPTLWDKFTVTPSEFLESGNSVIVLGEQKGSSKATGRQVNIPFVHIFTMSNGICTRMEEFYDTATEEQALGQ